MNKSFSLTFRQLLLLVVLIVLITIGLTLVVFYIGQQNGIRLAFGEQPTPTSTPTMPPLPKAMTATPELPQVVTFEITEEDILSALADQSGAQIPIAVRDVNITPQDVSLTGDIDYLGYRGELQLVGTPYVSTGDLRVQITQVTINGQNIPQALYPTIEEQINLTFEQLLNDYQVQGVNLEDGKMVLTVAS